jgi:hypothetical protein
LKFFVYQRDFLNLKNKPEADSYKKYNYKVKSILKKKLPNNLLKVKSKKQKKLWALLVNELDMIKKKLKNYENIYQDLNQGLENTTKN